MDNTKVGQIAVPKTDVQTSTPIKTEEIKTAIETTSSNKSIGIASKAKSCLDDKFKTDVESSFGELLGSVTTHNCPGVRASARVIQKMKQDSIRPPTPPPNEKDSKSKDDKMLQKTPSHPKASTKTSWTNIERNYFFDALNEVGKDFEAIGSYINSKLKRKSSTDAAFKTKDQVRAHYYQTFHKICKYIRFSDEVKKPAQELYTLINYGEMRRKLQFLTDKHFMKLKHLVYNGYITIRCKGKNLRIKTPTCKALRRLNQLDDSLEDIKLPSKIEVIISPANMESFGKVQALAQNPKAKATVSLQKKLVNFIKTFQYKWRSSEMKLAEEESKVIPNNSATETEMGAFNDPLMCFRPKPGVPIHRPLLNITEFLSSLSLSLSAYENRIGVKIRSESLCQDRIFANKRQRCDSGSEKRSPDNKKLKTSDILNESMFPMKEDPSMTPGQHATENDNYNNGDGDLSDELIDILSLTELRGDNVTEHVSDNDFKCLEGDQRPENENPSNCDIKDNTFHAANEGKGKSGKKRRDHRKNVISFKPLISDDVIKKIRKGWTILNADDITIGDLYVVFGQDSKLELDYFWINDKKCVFNQKQNGMPYSINDCEEPELVNSLAKSTLGNKLKHLLLIASLSERVRKKQCSCGHTCEKMTKPRLDREIVTKSFVSSKTFQLSAQDSGIFRQPVVPFRRPGLSLDAIKQMPNGSRLKMSKQVLVQRMLLPHRSGQAYDVVNVNDLQNKLVNQDESPLTNNSSQNELTLTNEMTPEPSVEKEEEIDKNKDENDSITFTNKNLPSSSDQSPQEETLVRNATSSDTIEFDDSSTSSIFKGLSPMSPLQLLRDTSSNARWLEENLNDFSLNSLLGHLDEINGNRDITDQSSNLSVISESSVDYMTKFAEITASMQNEEKDL